MTQPYHDLIDLLDEHTAPWTQLSLEGAFILYLVGGQLALVLLWWLLRRGVGRWDRPGESLHTGGGVAFVLCLFVSQIALMLAWPYLASACLTANRDVLADVVGVAHFVLIVFVLLFLVLILVGWPLGWQWTRNFWLRLLHLTVIVIIAGQEFTGIECPFTTVERELRGGPANFRALEGASALGRFCHKVVFYSNTDFLIAYISLAVLVVATWVFIRPREPWDAAPAGGEPSR
jgi:hypothetical protein